MEGLRVYVVIEQIFKCQAGKILHDSVVIEAAAVRPQHENYLRHGINYLLQLALRLLAFGDISNDGDATDNFPAGVEERRKMSIQKNLLTCIGESVRNVGRYHPFARQRLGVTVLTT
jgi:hypothetical protein